MSIISLSTFLKYIHDFHDGSVDASGVLSKACFEEWISTLSTRRRNTVVENPERKFQRALSGHLTGLE
jgi:hypothetical protein